MSKKPDIYEVQVHFQNLHQRKFRLFREDKLLPASVTFTLLRYKSSISVNVVASRTMSGIITDKSGYTFPLFFKNVKGLSPSDLRYTFSTYLTNVELGLVRVAVAPAHPGTVMKTGFQADTSGVKDRKIARPWTPLEALPCIAPHFKFPDTRGRQ